jgi:[acyl-carrier-protein] S-malonyltransferase
LYEKEPNAKKIFEEADQTLETKLSTLMFEGDAKELTLTYNAQPSLLTASTAALQKLKEYGIKADYAAGHSLGEYSALVAAGALSFKDAVYAVRKRGEFMNEAVPAGEGAMAAILGMDSQALKEVTDKVSEEGNLVQLANLNCPGRSSSREQLKASSSLQSLPKKRAQNARFLSKSAGRSIPT